MSKEDKKAILIGVGIGIGIGVVAVATAPAPEFDSCENKVKLF